MSEFRFEPPDVEKGYIIELMADGFGANQEFQGAKAYVIDTEGSRASAIELIDGPVHYGRKHQLTVTPGFWSYKIISKREWDD